MNRAWLWLLVASSAWGTPPIFHGERSLVLTPADGGSINLGLTRTSAPVPAVLFVNAVLDGNAQLTIDQFNGPQWIVLTGQAGATAAPVSYFDVITSGVSPSAFTAKLHSLDGGQAAMRQFAMTIMPLRTETSYEFTESAAQATVATSGWSALTGPLLSPVAGDCLLLGGCAAWQQPRGRGIAVRLRLFQSGDSFFPVGRPAGDLSWFFTDEANPQGGFIAAYATLVPGSKLLLEAHVSPQRDGGANPGNSAECVQSRIALIPFSIAPVAAKNYVHQLNDGGSGTTAVTVPTTAVNLVPGLVYVQLEQVYEHQLGSPVSTDFRVSGVQQSSIPFNGVTSSGNIPVTHVGLLKAPMPGAALETSVNGNVEAWGSLTLLFGPFDGGVVNLIPTLMPDAGIDAGAPDSGAVVPPLDSGVRDAGPPPVFRSDPPRDGFCYREWQYTPLLEAPPGEVTLRLDGAPRGAAVVDGMVNWTPEGDQSGRYRFTVIASTAGGEAAQEVVVVVPPCRLDYTPCGCGAAGASWPALPLVFWAALRLKRNRRR